MFKTGIISEIDSDKGLARVEFRDDKIVSYWLPIIVAGTFKNKYSFPLDINEQVVCVMDKHAEEGYILGAIYSQDVEPDIKGDDKTGVTFEDGTTIVYDRAAHELCIDVKGDLKINVQGDALIQATGTVKIDAPTTEATGNLNVSGSIKANGDVTAAANTLPISLLTHKHTSPIGPTGPPFP